MVDVLFANCSSAEELCPGYPCSSIAADGDLGKVFFYDDAVYQQPLYNACNCTSFHKDTHRGVSLES
jgi:hypothetical protein